ncbi:MAG: UDP-N-acetylmuramate dehydrogenase [Planctomycetota bacterium]
MSIEWPTNWFDDPNKIKVNVGGGTSRNINGGADRNINGRAAFGGVRTDVLFRDLTTFRIGGPAKVLVEPLDPDSAAEVVRRACERNVKLKILGNGSNLLVSDAGFDGVVMSTARMRRAIRQEEYYHLWAGTPLVGFVNDAAKAGLSGVEGIIGIPAMIGGAIAMNAGGRWGEIFDVVETVTICELSTGEVRTLRKPEMQPKYRDANLGNVMVLETTLKLRPADRKTVVEETKSHLIEKNSSQPVTEPSPGCIFKNPKPHSAAQLIDVTGLKGTRIGGVEVSRKHANYFVNVGGGTCDDANRLIDHVRERVAKEHNIELETEVKIW